MLLFFKNMLCILLVAVKRTCATGYANTSECHSKTVQAIKEWLKNQVVRRQQRN